MTVNRIKSAIESLLFVYSEPISVYRLAKTINVDKKVIDECLKELNQDYIKNNRGFRLIEVNNKFQLGTNKDNHIYIEEFCKKSSSKGLSSSALEVLAIVAYKQPVTRIDIESIRGVRSGNLITYLLTRDLIYISGKLEAIGTPNIYNTTEMFLKSFGFETIKELPKIDDFHNFEFLSSLNINKKGNNND
ncbi:MAG: SMC-Scp complex subunit ScpB [Bacillota bacterium]|nr:SMC-Scp complex subunit ScpB [Bacillota bacterium]